MHIIRNFKRIIFFSINYIIYFLFYLSKTKDFTKLKNKTKKKKNMI